MNMAAMSRSESEAIRPESRGSKVSASPVPPLPFIMLGVAGSKRAGLMQSARSRLGVPLAQIVEWRDWLASPRILDRYFESPCYFKIEPPGDDPQAHYHLLEKGCALLGRSPPARPAHAQVVGVDAWFRGFSDALGIIDAQLSRHPHVRIVNAPSELALMTDKFACQLHFKQRQVPTPALLGRIESYDHLQALMDEHGLDRIYLKARFGSSASGVVAYRRNKQGREQATTSAHLVHTSQGPSLYNVKRLRTYESRQDIRLVTQLLVQQEAYAEAWVPKPRAGTGHYDIRIVTLGGCTAHRVARIGKKIMTNLHLDSCRADVQTLLSTDDQEALEHAAATAAGAFPKSHVVGFDIVVGKKRVYVLEANGFGDLLPGLLWQGRDTYAAQLQELVPTWN